MFDKSFVQELPGAVRLTDGRVDRGLTQLVREWDGERCRASLRNVSCEPVQIKEVALFYGRFPVSADCPFYAEGYHMLTQHAGTLAEPYVIGHYGHDEEFFHLEKSQFSPDTYTAYNCMLLSPTQVDRILMGFTSCRRFQSEFRFRNNYIEIVMDCENLTLRPGETWRFEEFVVLNGEGREEIFARFAARINENHPRRRYPEIPNGWCSYHAISGVRAEDMYEQARAMKGRIPELKRIQIDAGYQSSTDWLIPNPRTGADMKEICDRIREIGCEPAGYLSPFSVADDSQLFRDHPDWVVKDAQGNPTNEHCHAKHWYILDGTHPEAVAYIRKVLRTMHDEWGIRYFKLDFTSYGALPGFRHDPDKTRVEAFRAVFEAINDEVSGDSYILGCNAPFWPQLGLVDGNRTTNDVFRRWETIHGNMEELEGRLWQNRLWILDPDGVVLEKIDRSDMRDGHFRKRNCTLCDAEFEYHKAYIVACGGVITSGDKLDEMSEANLDVLRRMMACTGDPAVFDDDSFEIGRIEQNGKNIICVFNHSDQVKSIAVPLRYKSRLVDFWTDEYIGEYEGHYTLFDMVPHSSRVIKVI